MPRLLLIVLTSACLSGCFVLDELDKGDALLEQHSVGLREKREREAKEAAEAAAAKPSTRLAHGEPGVREKLEELWKDALEEERPPPDPSDVIVQCAVSGSVRFTRKSDCELRGGRITLLQPKSESRTGS